MAKARRKSNFVPQGKDILNPNWIDAKWDVGVLFLYDTLLFNFLDFVQKQYNYILPIHSVFGGYNVKWSGGRNMRNNVYSWDYKGWTPETTIKKYNKRGIGVTFTFSNNLLKEEHLSDPSANYLLDLLAKQKYEKNAVAITSDLLSDYIRKKYPDLKQKASVVKITTEMPQKRTFEYYDSLFDKYDIIYLHPDDNLNLKLMEKIAKSGKVDRYEPLINERCAINCTIRKNHYDEISKPVIDGWHGMFNFSNVDFIHDPNHPKTICERITRSKLRSCTLSKDELKGIYDLGFRTFKLQGRDTDWSAMLYNFSTWIFEQDCIAERMFTQ